MGRRRNILLVHVNKTGGSSIHAALKKPQRHRSVREFIDQYGLARFRRFFCVGTVRNSYDRTVSQYFYRLESQNEDLKLHPIPFEEWVIRTFEEHDPLYFQDNKLFRPQLEWFLDYDNRFAVKHLIRFHSIQRDFNTLCRIMRIPIVKLPHIKKSKHKHYSHYYTPRAKKVIEDWFAVDIAKWKFTFK